MAGLDPFGTLKERIAESEILTAGQLRVEQSDDVVSDAIVAIVLTARTRPFNVMNIEPAVLNGSYNPAQPINAPTTDVISVNQYASRKRVERLLSQDEFKFQEMVASVILAEADRIEIQIVDDQPALLDRAAPKTQRRFLMEHLTSGRHLISRMTDESIETLVQRIKDGDATSDDLQFPVGAPPGEIPGLDQEITDITTMVTAATSKAKLEKGPKNPGFSNEASIEDALKLQTAIDKAVKTSREVLTTLEDGGYAHLIGLRRLGVNTLSSLSASRLEGHIYKVLVTTGYEFPEAIAKDFEGNYPALAKLLAGRMDAGTASAWLKALGKSGVDGIWADILRSVGEMLCKVVYESMKDEDLHHHDVTAFRFKVPVPLTTVTSFATFRAGCSSEIKRRIAVEALEAEAVAELAKLGSGISNNNPVWGSW